MAETFLDSYKRLVTGRHPHFSPLNVGAFRIDVALAASKANSLHAYQQYLATARRMKAQPQRVSQAFERTVLRYAGQARDDTRAFAAATLRVTQQINHTSLWRQMLHDAATSVQAGGPVTVKQLWAEVQKTLADPRSATALAGLGLTSEVAAALNDGLANVDATLASANGKLSIQAKATAKGPPVVLPFRTPGEPPGSITDLLRRSQFDQVVSALSGNDTVYLEAVPSLEPIDFEPSDLIAAAAVMLQQSMNGHVRKIEDIGLGTMQGSDVITGLFVVGLLAGAFGAAIIAACDQPGAPPLPSGVCLAGFLLGMIALMALGFFIALGAMALGPVVGLIAIGAYSFLLVYYIESLHDANV